MIQGRQELSQWVESFTVATSLDGIHWYDYTDMNAQVSPTRFNGNFDQLTPVRAMFDREIDARFLRIYPKTWHNTIAMRFEVLSCYGPAILQTTVRPPLVSGETPTLVPPFQSGETPTARPPWYTGGTPTAAPGKIEFQLRIFCLFGAF